MIITLTLTLTYLNGNNNFFFFNAYQISYYKLISEIYIYNMQYVNMAQNMSHNDLP